MSWFKSIKEWLNNLYNPVEARNNNEWEIITLPAFDILIPDILSRVIIFCVGMWVLSTSIFFICAGNLIVLLFTFYFASRRRKALQSFLKMRVLSYKTDNNEGSAIVYNENNLLLKTEKMSENGWLTIILVLIPFISIVSIIISIAEVEGWGEKDYGLLLFDYLPFILIYLALSISLIAKHNRNFVGRKILNIYRNNHRFTRVELKEMEEFLEGKRHKEKKVLLSEMNDFLIIDIQKKLEIFRQRLDNLSFESVFLGALTFATFVQLTSDGFFDKEVITSDILNFSWLNFNGPSKEQGIKIVAIGSLISSVFYIVVLMKRFSILTAIENAQLKVERAKTWNIREEANVGTKSLEKFTDLIQHELASALEISENIEANLNITSLIRMLGLYMFFLVLLTSAFMLHPDLFLLIMVAAIYGLVASVIMFGFKKRVLKLLFLKHLYEKSSLFIIARK